jgi:hypothetical protein
VTFVRAIRAGRAGSRRPVDSDRAAEELRERREMWVETLEPFLGLLDAETQERLARAFPSFDPHRSTRASILGEAVVALVLALAATYGLAAKPPDLDAGSLLGAAALGADAWRRHSGFRRGRVPGSFVGVPLRPIAHRWLGDRDRPAG